MFESLLRRDFSYSDFAKSEFHKTHVQMSFLDVSETVFLILVGLELGLQFDDLQKGARSKADGVAVVNQRNFKFLMYYKQ